MSVFDQSATKIPMRKTLKPEYTNRTVPRTRLLKGEIAVGVPKPKESVFDFEDHRKVLLEKPAAERAFSNPDVVASILGMRRAFHRAESWGEQMKKVMDEYFWDETYDDGERISTSVIAGPLLEQLRKGSKKVKVAVPYGSFYGGEGSGNGNSIDMFRECLEATKHSFTVSETEREMTDEEYRSLSYYEYLEMNKEDMMEEKLAARDEDDDDDVSIGLNTPPFDYHGTVVFTLTAKDDNERKEAIEWLEMYDKRAEYGEEEREQEDLVKYIDRDIDRFLELYGKLTKAMPTSQLHKKDEYRRQYNELEEGFERRLQNVKNIDVRNRLIKRIANE